MDNSTLDNLLIAKRLLLIADQQSQTGERYACSAGLITLQDALELVFIACLAKKKLGKPATFDGMIEKLEENGCTILNKAKLQGLNKIRVSAKHYGITTDQYTLKEALNKSIEAIEHLVFTVFGKPYHQIYSAELIQHPETKAFLERAAQILEAAPFYPYECLLNIRKAVFINFEEMYSIEEWKNIEREQDLSFIESFTFRREAPFYYRNKDWIEKNVLSLFDYIQIDYSEIRNKLLGYGISPPTFFNLLRLTPKVFRSRKKIDWKSEGNFAFMETSKETAGYCLSTVVEMVLLKENYDALHRLPPEELKMQIQVTKPTFLYRKTSVAADKIQSISPGEIFHTNSFLPSFDDDSLFVEISEFREKPKAEWLRGYIPADHVDHYNKCEEATSIPQNLSPSSD